MGTENFRPGRWLFTLMFWNDGGLLRLALSVMAVIVIFGALGILISAALTLCSRLVRRQDAAAGFQGTSVRFIFLGPCAFFGLYVLYTSVIQPPAGAEILSSHPVLQAASVIFALLSNAAFAAGLWNPHWRRVLNEAS